jgi:hypothetical protein
MKILNYPSSGSYQSLTFSRNRNGQYVRTRAIPVNPSTTFQLAVRSRLTTAAQDWRELTALQREGWATLGEQITRTDSLGQGYTLTGFQAYVLINNNRLAAAEVKVSDAPAHLPPDPILSVTATITAATYSVAWTPTPLAAGEKLFCSCSPQRSAGRNFEGDYRLILVSPAAAASPLVVFTAYTARMGTPLIGNKIFTSVQRYLNGFLSTPIATSTVVV